MKNITINHPVDSGTRLFVSASITDRVEIHSMSLRKNGMIVRREKNHLGAEYLEKQGFDPREVSFEIEEALMAGDE